MLEIISFAYRSGNHYYYNVRCECGIEFIIRKDSIKQTKSCGCHQSNVVSRWTPEENVVLALHMKYRDGDLTKEDIKELIFQKCYYCDHPGTNVYKVDRKNGKYKGIHKIIHNGIDRIDNSRGHYKDNVVPCCINCNAGKNVNSKEEFLEQVKRIYDNRIQKQKV
jgi:hypothetical protein